MAKTNNPVEYDLIIIGGGPGGYVAAIKAAQLGKKVAIIEKDKLGGVCLNYGCIPTKALLESAELYSSIVDANKMGIRCNEVKANMLDIVNRSRKIVDKLTAGVAYLMKKNQITVYNGHGKLKSSGIKKLVSIDEEQVISAPKIIIATGASSRKLPKVKLGARVWDSKQALLADSIPKSMIILGAGAIGLEFASFFNAMGTKVEVIECADRILTFADADISEYALQIFRANGITFSLNTGISSIEATEKSVLVTQANSLNVREVEACLISIGITPNISDIGLENAPGVKVANGIVVGSGYQTGEPGVYAIGDVLQKGPWLAHKAMQEGVRCVENMYGQPVPDLEEREIPICVYSMPQVAQIGLTEKQAIDRGIKIKKHTTNLTSNGKALTEGNNGIIKIILEEDTGIFVGAHLVGNHVTELISNYSIFQYFEGLNYDMSHIIFPHPTLSELVQEAFMASDGSSIHG